MSSQSEQITFKDINRYADPDNTRVALNALDLLSLNEEDNNSYGFQGLMDDIGDFYKMSKTQGISAAVNRTKAKLFGEEAPIIDPTEWTEHGENYKTKELRPGVTSFLSDGEDTGSFGEIIDLNAFVFGGGLSGDQSYRKHDSDDWRDIAFAGRPGEFEDGVFQEIGADLFSSKDIETANEGAMWLSPGDERGLKMSTERPDNALSHVQKIFDYNTLLESKEKWVGEEWTLEDFINEGFPYEISDEESIKPRAMFRNPPYNLIAGKDGVPLSLLHVGMTGGVRKIPANNSFSPKPVSKAFPVSIHEIIKHMESLDSDELYLLDAGMNEAIQYDRDPKGQFEYDHTVTVGGTHIGYE